MPMIEEVKYKGGETIKVKPFTSPAAFMEAAYDVLHDRLAPEKLDVLDEEQGWMLTSFKSKSLGNTDQVAV